MAGHVVCTSLDEARRYLAEGTDVILLLAPGDEPDLGSLTGPGRWAVWVGDPGDPPQRGWGEEMGAELLGGPAQ